MEVLYIIFNQFGIPVTLVRLIKTCLNETYSKDQIRKHLSTYFLFRKLWNKLFWSPLLFNFVVAHAIRKAVGRQNGMKPLGHIGFYADGVTLLCENIIFLHHEAACVSHTFQTKNYMTVCHMTLACITCNEPFNLMWTDSKTVPYSNNLKQVIQTQDTSSSLPAFTD
jgi:hypothetical protein